MRGIRGLDGLRRKPQGLKEAVYEGGRLIA